MQHPVWNWDQDPLALLYRLRRRLPWWRLGRLRALQRRSLSLCLTRGFAPDVVTRMFFHKSTFLDRHLLQHLRVHLLSPPSLPPPSSCLDQDGIRTHTLRSCFLPLPPHPPRQLRFFHFSFSEGRHPHHLMRLFSRSGTPAAWGGWGGWGACSTGCGTGTQPRTRACDRNCYGSCTTGSDSDHRSCNAGRRPLCVKRVSWNLRKSHRPTNDSQCEDSRGRRCSSRVGQLG